MTDETDKPGETPAFSSPDPMAKARAARARKQLEKAEAEAKAAEASAASQAKGQPTVSTLRNKPVNPYMGELVKVRVTPWGHAEISTGGEDGFERYAAGAEIDMPDLSARSLFNKRWIEPLNPADANRWVEENRRELIAAMRAKARIEEVLANGAPKGKTDWMSKNEGGELSFNATERDLKSIGIA